LSFRCKKWDFTKSWKIRDSIDGAGRIFFATHLSSFCALPIAFAVTMIQNVDRGFPQHLEISSPATKTHIEFPQIIESRKRDIY
jgi:hypothetical protein